jgi:hypothetical protein
MTCRHGQPAHTCETCDVEREAAEREARNAATRRYVVQLLGTVA